MYNFANNSMNPELNQGLQDFYSLFQKTLTKVDPELKLTDATNSIIDGILIHNLLITRDTPITHLLIAYIMQQLFNELETSYSYGVKIYGYNNPKAIITIYAD